MAGVDPLRQPVPTIRGVCARRPLPGGGVLGPVPFS